MANFEDIAKKAFYMGIGFASYAQEKANDTVKDFKVQAQKLADEMTERGEMNAEEARKFVDELIEQAKQGNINIPQSSSEEKREPRRIEIVDEEETAGATNSEKEVPSETAPESDVDLRQQVQNLQEELRRLKNEI